MPAMARIMETVVACLSTASWSEMPDEPIRGYVDGGRHLAPRRRPAGRARLAEVVEAIDWPDG